MARTNGPIQVWHRTDTIPSDAEGGYAGGDSTAAAVGTSLAQSSSAIALAQTALDNARFVATRATDLIAGWRVSPTPALRVALVGSVGGWSRQWVREYAAVTPHAVRVTHNGTVVKEGIGTPEVGGTLVDDALTGSGALNGRVTGGRTWTAGTGWTLSGGTATTQAADGASIDTGVSGDLSVTYDVDVVTAANPGAVAEWRFFVGGNAPGPSGLNNGFWLRASKSTGGSVTVVLWKTVGGSGTNLQTMALSGIAANSGTVQPLQMTMTVAGDTLTATITKDAGATTVGTVTQAIAPGDIQGGWIGVRNIQSNDGAWFLNRVHAEAPHTPGTYPHVMTVTDAADAAGVPAEVDAALVDTPALAADVSAARPGVPVQVVAGRDVPDLTIPSRSERAGGGVPIPIPGWTLPVTVKRDGATWVGDIDLEALQQRGQGPTMYVDPATGNDSNDGLTWTTAKATPQGAAGGSGYQAAEIIVNGGIWERKDSPYLGRADLIVRAAPGTRPVFTECDRSTSWSSHSGNAHSLALTSTGVVFDLTAPTTTSGLPIPLTRVESTAEVIATPGTAYYESGTVYVHLHDGRAPDSNVLVSRTTYSLNTTAFPVDGPRRILVEGIEFWGGRSARLRSEAPGAIFTARNCAWRYTGDDALSVTGYETVALVGCEATHAGNDGFNYHDWTGLTGQVVEIGCTGRLNGQFPGSSQNGSTAHDNYKIVRVGGSYEYNPGPNVADVNHVHSANFGVYAGDATEGGLDAWDYTVPELTGTLTLVDCTSTSPQAVRGNGKTAFVSGFRRTGTTNGTYTPYA